MSSFNTLGVRGVKLPAVEEISQQQVIVQRPLQRVLAFRGRNIDDVVNHWYVKNEILGYWKLHKQIERTSETVELERQWNGGNT
jgi:hypothetical protein